MRSCPPVFVPRPGSCQEDDGLLVVDLAAPDGSGVLLFLCGRTLREVGRARLPEALPAGQHCAFYPAPELTQLSLQPRSIQGAAPVAVNQEPDHGSS